MECLTPGCWRIPNPFHRHCCKDCRQTRGQEHTARCCRDLRRGGRSRTPSRRRSPFRSNRARRQNEAEVSNVTSAEIDDAPTVPISTGIESRRGNTISDDIPCCKICHEAIIWTCGRSVTTNCGHLYCYGCWRHFVQVSTALNLRCPSCRDNVEFTVRIYG